MPILVTCGKCGGLVNAITPSDIAELFSPHGGAILMRGRLVKCPKCGTVLNKEEFELEIERVE